MKKLIVSVALAGLSVLAWALPTLQQVEAEVGRGNYAQAESMMREVVAAKPGSARAHYIYAEILAHQGKLALAAESRRPKSRYYVTIPTYAAILFRRLLPTRALDVVMASN